MVIAQRRTDIEKLQQKAPECRAKWQKKQNRIKEFATINKVRIRQELPKYVSYISHQI